MRCFTRAFLGLAAAFWFTLAFAPRVRQALINYSERPLPKEWEGPKYRQWRGGELYDDIDAVAYGLPWPPPPTTDPEAFERTS